MRIGFLFFAMLFASSAMADQTVSLTPVSAGIADKIGGSYYMSAKLSETKPPAIKKLPADLSDHVMYGLLKFRNPGGNEIAVVIDSPDGKPSRLFVDSNGNGDLTDDAPTDWVAGGDYKGALPGLHPANLANVGGATLKLGTAAKSFDARIGIWKYDPGKMKGRTPEQFDELRHDLKYYRAYATTGKITIDGKQHDVYLLDEMVKGTFNPADSSLVRIFIDMNDNGKVDAEEMFDIAKPMKINGNSYEAKDISPDGTSFTFGPTDKIAHSPEDVKPGQIALAFTAVNLDGKPVQFPQDYKGKIVLLDFWATWCAPCMAEVPNVVAAYQKHHTDGFEILGVTLDQPDDGDKVKATIAKHKMDWPQLFADPGKSKSIAELYSVTGIPSAFLIDGTTGKILTAGNDLRGDGLEKALAKYATTQPAAK